MVLRQRGSKKMPPKFFNISIEDSCVAQSQRNIEKYLTMENSGDSSLEISTEESGVDISNFFLCLVFMSLYFIVEFSN